MNPNLLLALQDAGVDTESALRRFSNSAALYERFLSKFPADENYEKIAPACTSGDWETALAAVHTLKGVSGNLGMDRLYHACSETVALLRAGQYEQACASLTELEGAYQAVCTALKAGQEEV